MMKFSQLMTYGVGDKSVSFTGRESFRVDSYDFEVGLLATGCFEKTEDGALRYSGKVSVADKDGHEHQVDAKGYLNIKKEDLIDGKNRKDFI